MGPHGDLQYQSVKSGTLHGGPSGRWTGKASLTTHTLLPVLLFLPFSREEGEGRDGLRVRKASLLCPEGLFIKSDQSLCASKVTLVGETDRGSLSSIADPAGMTLCFAVQSCNMAFAMTLCYNFSPCECERSVNN